jgi:hypothetical protein
MEAIRFMKGSQRVQTREMQVQDRRSALSGRFSPDFDQAQKRRAELQSPAFSGQIYRETNPG